MASERTLKWREKNKDLITQWRNQVQELRNLANLECWSYERLEIEIAQRLSQDVREIFDFASFYTRRYKSGGFRHFMFEVSTEILEYGILEPSEMYKIKKSIESAQRRMNAKKTQK